MALCECGCGSEIRDSTRFARGHHWRVKRSEHPTTKTCEWCRREYSREVALCQTTRHWLARRFCSEPCRRAWRAAESRRLRGPLCPNWKGDKATPQAGRKRARETYRDPKPCEVCGAKAERHHRDDNPLNNAPENIKWFCRKHHLEADGRMHKAQHAPRRARNPERRARIVAMRREGFTLEQIADCEGIHSSAVHGYLRRAARDTT